MSSRHLKKILNAQSMKILIAEDDPISNRILQKNLETWGHEAIVTCDGEQALKVMQAEDSPHLAILDWMMPGMDGEQVCKQVSEMTKEIRPYLILLTARAGHADVVRGMEAGADDFIAKPFHRDELHARLRAGIRIIKLQQGLQAQMTKVRLAQKQIQSLQGLLPICAWCKSIRSGEYWQKVEQYIQQHGEIRFTHCICPDCLKKQNEKLALSKRAATQSTE